VVDDEVSVCKVLGKFLATKGFEVSETYGGEECLEAYKRERADVVLLDVRMPGKDGLDTLVDLMAFDPEAKVIMVTAVHEEELAQKALTEGALDYITKPIDPDYLEMVILAKTDLLSGDE
jgi:DNA-binding NtrC family response regulator